MTRHDTTRNSTAEESLDVIGLNHQVVVDVQREHGKNALVQLTDSHLTL